MRRSAVGKEPFQQKRHRDHSPEDCVLSVPFAGLCSVQRRPKRRHGMCERRLCRVARGPDKEREPRRGRTAQAHISSLSTCEETTEHRTETGDFARNTPAQKEAMAVVIQTKSRRKPNCPAGGQIPSDHRREVVGGVMQTEAVPISETAIKFGPGYEVLPAKRTPCGRSFEGKRTTRRQGIT